MSCTIRTANPDDAATVARIAAETFALACPPDTPDAEIQAYIAQSLQASDFENMLQNPALQLRVATTEANKVIGFSLVNLQPEATGVAEGDDMPELSKCYVLPQYHGSGIAAQLVAESLRSINGPVRLTVSQENPRAIAFYKKRGFAIVGETTFQVGDDLHRDWVMRYGGTA